MSQTSSQDEFAFDGFPPTDESGDVDLSLVEYCLSLTPVERLRNVEEFAEFILASWRARGIPWFDSERS